MRVSTAVGLLVGFATLAPLQVLAAQLVAIDEVRDRIVRVDTASGEVETLVAGNDVRADRIVWSPDESFAYLLDRERDRMLVYDPAVNRIVKRIPIEDPREVVFQTHLRQAYVRVGNHGLMVVATDSHEPVGSLPGGADYLALSGSGRWLFAIYDSRPSAVHDLYESTSSEIEWRPGGTKLGVSIQAVGVTHTSDHLVLLGEQAVWTFDPTSGESRRFPFRGAALGLRISPTSQRAFVVTHREVADIELSSGATRVRQLSEALSARRPFRDSDRQIRFSDDGAAVVIRRGWHFVAHDLETWDVLWESDDDDGGRIVSFPRSRHALFFAGQSHFDPSGPLSVLDGGRPVGASARVRKLRDVGWRETDRSYYVLSDRGVERIASVTAEHETLVADSRFVSLAAGADGERVFVWSKSDLAIRELSVGDRRRFDLFHTFVSVREHLGSRFPLTFDPFGQRLLVSTTPELTVFDLASGTSHYGPALYDRPEWFPEGSIALGFVHSVAVLRGGYVVVGRSENPVAVFDLESGALLAEHSVIDDWETGSVSVVSETGGRVALVGATKHASWNYGHKPVVARISEQGLLRRWVGESGYDLVAVAPAATEGHAFVALSHDQVGGLHEIHLVDLATGALLAKHLVPGRVGAMVADGVSVYAAVDANPSLLVLDAETGALIGATGGDVRFRALEVLDPTGGHAGVRPMTLPAGRTPPDTIVAASGENGDITVWNGGARVTHTGLGMRHEDQVAFGASGLLYAGPTRRDGDFLVVLEPISGAVVAEIPLDGEPGRILPTPDGELVFVQTRFGSGSGLTVVDPAENEVVHEIRPERAWHSPSMSPDGSTIVAHDGANLIVLDVSTAVVESYPIETAPVSLAAADDRVFIAGEDDRVWSRGYHRDSPEVDTRVTLPSPSRYRIELAVDEGILVAYHAGNYEGDLWAVSVAGNGAHQTSALGSSPRLLSIAAHLGRAYGGRSSLVDVWDVANGARIARLVRPSGFDGGNLIWSIAVGCVGPECSQPVPVSDVEVWRRIPTATPTIVPTPTPGVTPPVRQEGVWLRVDGGAGLAGEIIDIEVGRSGYDDELGVWGFQLDLWFSGGISPREWLPGVPDCGIPWRGRFLASDDQERYHIGAEFLPGGCAPPHDCPGLRLLVTGQSNLEAWPPVICRAEIEPATEPGTYPIGVSNLYVDSDEVVPRLQVLSQDVIVLAQRGDPTPTPDWMLRYYGPTPAPTPILTLGGRGVETDAGWTNDVEFKLTGSSKAPFKGELSTAIEANYPLELVVDEDGSPMCRFNPELSSGASFELRAAGCNGTDGQARCDALAVKVQVDPGSYGYDSGDPPVWYYRPDIWLFRCQVRIDPAALDGQYYLRFDGASFGERSVRTEDLLVDVFVPWLSPTPTPTSTATATVTPTPTFLKDPRPCEPIERGRAIVCVNDLEADPGQVVRIAAHYRSGAVDLAGLEFEIWSGPVEILGAPASELRKEEFLCRANPAAEKGDTVFASTPHGTVKVIVISFSDLSPIRDDVELLGCDALVPQVPGTYEIRLEQSGASDAAGVALPLDVRSGFLRVRGEVPPTPTARFTASARPSPTPTSASAAWQIDRGEDVASSGCHIGPPQLSGSSFVILLVPLLGWVAARVRSQRLERDGSKGERTGFGC